MPELRPEPLEAVDHEALLPGVGAVGQGVLHHLWSPDQLQAELGASLLFLMLTNSQWMQIKPPVVKSNPRRLPVFQAMITSKWPLTPPMNSLGNLTVPAEVLYAVLRCSNINAPAASADAAFNKTHPMAREKRLMCDFLILLPLRSVDRITFSVAATSHGPAQP